MSKALLQNHAVIIFSFLKVFRLQVQVILQHVGPKMIVSTIQNIHSAALNVIWSAMGILRLLVLDLITVCL